MLLLILGVLGYMTLGGLIFHLLFKLDYLKYVYPELISLHRGNVFNFAIPIVFFWPLLALAFLITSSVLIIIYPFSYMVKIMKKERY